MTIEAHERRQDLSSRRGLRSEAVRQCLQAPPDTRGDVIVVEPYDNPSDPELGAKFYRVGKVVFIMSASETPLLRSLMQDDIRLGATTRRKGWQKRLASKYLMVSGIVKTLFLSFYSPSAAGVFNFFVINKGHIRNFDEKKTSDGRIILTFHKKKKQT